MIPLFSGIPPTFNSDWSNLEHIPFFYWLTPLSAPWRPDSVGLQRGKRRHNYNEFVNISKLILWRNETRCIRVLRLCSWAFARGFAGITVLFRGESMQHDIHVRVPRIPSEYHSLYHCCFLDMFGLHLAKCTISCNVK